MRAIISRLSASRRPHSERNLLVAERERCVTTSAASAARRSPLTATALLFFFPVAQSVKDVDWEPQWKKEKENIVSFFFYSPAKTYNNLANERKRMPLRGNDVLSHIEMRVAWTKFRHLAILCVNTVQRVAHSFFLFLCLLTGSPFSLFSLWPVRERERKKELDSVWHLVTGPALS